MDRIQLTNSAIQTVMLNVVQHVRQPQSFFMDTFFKRRIMQDAVRAEYDEVKFSDGEARPQHPRHETSVVAGGKKELRTIEMAFFDESDVTTVWDTVLRQPGYGINDIVSKMDVLGARTAEGLANLRRRTQRTMERYCVESLMTGKLNVIGDSLKFTNDYHYEAWQTAAPGTLWNAPGSNPIDDLRAWANLMARNNGTRPTIAVMGTETAGAFLRNEFVKEANDVRRMDFGQIGFVDVGGGAVFRGTFEGVEVYEYTLTSVDEAGVISDVFDPKSMLLANTAETELVITGRIQNLYAPANVWEYPSIMENVGATQRFMRLQSTKIPAVQRPGSYLTIPAAVA